METPNVPEIRIGISRCLLGEEVRYDGGHKRDPYITKILGNFFRWIPVCPEFEAGFGVPRESVNLVRTADGIRMRGVHSGQDKTEQMNQYCVLGIQQLRDAGIHGFIFKKDSPSCGIEKVKIYDEVGAPFNNRGTGLFAEAFMRQFPLIPVEEEGRLQDPHLRENFIERVFGYYRFKQFTRTAQRSEDLVEFHTRHKMSLLSHSTEAYRTLGRLVANNGKRMSQDLVTQYGSLFMQALKKKATAKKHANVLYHLLGYLKKHIDESDKAELVTCIEQYRTGQVPLIVPITLLQHHFRRHPIDWIQKQTYLNPYPAELMLRNHL